MADAVSSLQVVVEGRDETTKVLKGIESSIIRFVGAVSAALATVSVVVFPVKAAATFQKELLNVAKTTDFTDSQITQLADELKSLSSRLNVTADDLAKIAAAGGQMGLGSEGVEGILTFTEAASRLASVLDITAEDAGNAIGRLTNIFKISVREAERISSLLNELSNNSTANGADLIDMTQRIGTAGGTLGIKQAAALAATGRDLGLTVETVGTSFNKIFLDLQTKAGDIAPVLGMPVEHFAKLVRTDGVEALKLYIAALAKMDNLQRAAFAEETTGGGRIFGLVTSLVKDASTGFTLLNKHLAEANTGFDEGKSAIKEQERVLSGLIAQLQILQNVFVAVAESAGRKALPYLTRLTKQLQDWAKDPTINESFDRFASFIGMVADAAIRLVQSITGLSGVMGPLLFMFKIFLGLKILGAVVGITAALSRQAKAVWDASAAWLSLITVNKEAVQSMAATAKKVEDASSAAAGTGKAAKLSSAGRLAVFMDSALAEKFAAQDKLTKLTEEQATAEKLLTERTAQRARVLGEVRAEMDRISSSSKAQAQAAYDSVIAAGGTKKAAKTAQNEVKAALNRATMDLQVAASNLEMRYSESIARRSENLKSISNQASATKTAIEGMSSAGLVMASMRTAITGVASSLGALVMRFLAVGGAIAGVISLATFFLSMFGVLDPVVDGLKSILGIADEAQAEQNRLAQERQKARAQEVRQADELLKIYQEQKKAKADAANVKAPDSTDVLGADLAKQAEQLRIINGAFLSLSAKSVELAGSIEFVNTRQREMLKQLREATAVYEELSKKKREQDLLGEDKPKTLSFRVSDRDVSAAKAKVDELTGALDLLGKARTRFEQAAQNNADQIKSVTEDAIAQAEKLAPLYDASGVSALKAFEKVVQARKKLEGAEKTRDELAKVGDTATASAEDKTKYITAAENAKILKGELEALSTVYEELKLSSISATVFMANAFPDATKATIEKVQALLKLLSKTGDELTIALDTSKGSLDEQAKEIEKKLDDIERQRKARLARLSDIPDKTAGSYVKAVLAIDDDAQAQTRPLKLALANVKVQQKALAMEAMEADALAAAYKRIGEAKQQATDAGQGLVSNFAATAAMKSLTDLQVAAQRRVEENAKFNAENIKKLYEDAKTHLVSVINESKREVASLGQYFQSRNLTLKLANFDTRQGRENEAYKKFQDGILDAERKRLEAQGLSSEEIAKQIGMLQDMFAWTDKIRQSQQDEARQRLILNELQTQIKKEQEAIAVASAKAVEYANKAKEAQAAGKPDDAAAFAEKAQVAAEAAKIATEGLTEKVKEFKSEAAKPVAGPLAASFVVSDAEVQAVVEKAAAARVQSAQAVEKAMGMASSAAEKWSVDQTTALETLKNKAVSYQQTLDAIAKLAPQLAALQNDLAVSVLSKAEGATSLVESLKSIANTDFRGLDQFATISAQSKEVEKMSGAIKDIARSYAETVVPAGQSIAGVVSTVKSSLEELSKAGGGTTEALKKAVSETTVPAKVAFPDATTSLQSQLDSRTFSANVRFSPEGAGVQKNAEGGLIRGPGTGTSDSILSWVSNGEFINDAQTTAFWGSDFFRMLKSIARGGRMSLSSFSTKMLGGARLPAFAGGGYVGAPTLAATGGAVGIFTQAEGGTVDRVAVDLTAGGEKVSLLGERKEVDKLVKALHRMNRG